MVMDIPVALPLLRIHLLRLAVTLILQLLMLDLLSSPAGPGDYTSHYGYSTADTGHTHPSSSRSPGSNSSQTCRRNLPTPEGIGRSSASAPRILLCRGSIASRRQFPTGTSPTYGDRSGSTWKPSKQAAGVLLQWDHWPHSCWSKAVGLTRGINPPNLPTTGVATSRFQRFPRMAIGFPITTKLQKAQHRCKNLAWMTRIPSLPMWTLLHLLSRFTNWQRSSGTFSTMTGMPTWPYSNVSRILMMTFPDTRFRSSRRQIWLILPVTWRNLHAHCRTKPVAWRHFLTRPCEL